MPTAFPANPTDGTIYKTPQGTIFIYEKSNNTWVPVLGDANIQPATPISNGLMTSADLRKLNRLYVPYPQTTLSTNQTNGQFVAGTINLVPLDDFITVTGTSHLSAAGIDPKFRISADTAGFNFGLNSDNLIKYLLDNGQLTVSGQTGDQGPIGKTGASGGIYNTGPKGQTGPPGIAPANNYQVSADPLQLKQVKGTNTATVGMEIQQTSDTEFTLILKQGAVGNPNINSSTLQVNCGDTSTWVASVPVNSGTSDQLYYVDVAEIISTIEAKYSDELKRLKTGNEEIVQFWLSKLMPLFDQNKSALCCQLFNCLKTVARIPKPQDINPKPLLVTVSTTAPDTTTTTAPDTTTTTAPASFMANQFIPAQAISQPVAIDQSTTAQTLVVTSDNTTQASAPTTNLAPGQYTIAIQSTNLNVSDQITSIYAGDISIAHSDMTKAIRFPKAGHFSQAKLAEKAYVGMTMDINHAGGLFGAFYNKSEQQNISGSVIIKITKKQDEQVCFITPEQVAEYQNIWSNRLDCCFVTSISGQDFMIIPCHNIKIMCSGHNITAIALPTFDGETIIPLGSSNTIVKTDKRLNEIVRANIIDGLTSVRGCKQETQITGNIWSSSNTTDTLLQMATNIAFPTV